MPGRLDTAGVRGWGLSLTLACLVALGLAEPLSAAAPPVEAPPLFQPERQHTEPLRMSADVVRLVGLGLAPRTGRLTALAYHAAGRHSSIDAWQFEDPLKNRYSRIHTGAATLVANSFRTAPGIGPALFSLGTISTGEYLDCWTTRDTDRLYAIPKRWLAVIADGRLGGPGGAEAGAYAGFLTQAHYTSDRAFRSGVRKDLTFAHLLENPETYRGQVVHVRGHLFRINRYEPPWEARHAGVSDLYEAWIFAEAFGAQPYCVLFTHWPRGLPRDVLGKAKINDPPLVTADGYFFKRYLYSASGPTKDREAPMVFGHTIRVEVLPVADSPAAGWLGGILVILAIIVFGVLGGVFVLTIWFRRSDQQLRQRLLVVRSPEFIMPPPDATPVAPVAMPVVKAEPVHAAPRFRIPPDLGEGGPPGRAGDRGPPEEPPEDAGS